MGRRPFRQAVPRPGSAPLVSNGVVVMNRLYYGTRVELNAGDLIEPGKAPKVGERDGSYIYLTPDLDAAIWEAEVANGEGAGRVYLVEPIGHVEDDPDRTK